jgi:hypothetical protein
VSASYTATVLGRHLEIPTRVGFMDYEQGLKTSILRSISGTSELKICILLSDIA